MDDPSFTKILHFFQLSMRGYRRVRKGVKKRLSRHMQELNCREVEDYLQVLEHRPAELQRAKELLTVSISRFFRDRHLWEVLTGFMIPELSSASPPCVRVWCAGCACGEEVYTLKIVWNQEQKKRLELPVLEIWATDINPVVLEKARQGIYPTSSLKEVPPALLDLYFLPDPEGFQIREELKNGIYWEIQDFLSAPPPTDSFDLIFVRNNLLTYYEPSISLPVLVKMTDALRWGGYLVIGNNEEIPSEDLPLKRSPLYRSIFLKTTFPIGGKI